MFKQMNSSIPADKRSSTGNLFFTDQFDNHPWEAPPELQPKTTKGVWPPRRRNLSSQEDQSSKEAQIELGGKDPAATLQAMAGENLALNIRNSLKLQEMMELCFPRTAQSPSCHYD